MLATWLFCGVIQGAIIGFCVVRTGVFASKPAPTGDRTFKRRAGQSWIGVVRTGAFASKLAPTLAMRTSVGASLLAKGPVLTTQ